MSHNIDKIIYINLNKRIDRKEEIENELNNFNLNYERFEAIETHGCGIIGCGKSHLAVLKIARDNNYKNILILEDDFTFLVSKEDFEDNLNNFFNLKLDFDICMISYSINKSENTNYTFIHKIIDAQTASGYIVNKKYYDKLINLYEFAMPLLEKTRQHWIYANDQIWKSLQKNDNWFAIIPCLGKQKDGYSDNTNSYVSYNC